MCGIFGWIQWQEELSNQDVLCARRATDSMVHRGPDASGEWCEGGVYMGHRRLSVIDLSDNAIQPFHSDDDRYVLTFNGEIYNYLELREELGREGYRFQSQSDTEVLLKALIAWDTRALNRLDGMFAGAFHDRKTARHVLFRDPLGQKPLYYCSDDRGLIYASEVRAFQELSDRTWRIDREAFRRYLVNAYYVADTSPFQGVRKLLPGMLIESVDGTVRSERWWDSIPGQDTIKVDAIEAAEEFERLFERSCSITMRSDVPVGVFLSGGVDSSMVLDSCHRLVPDIKSFSVSMEDADYDEGSKAREVAKHVGVKRHTSIMMDQEALLASFDGLMHKMDEPQADPGFVNVYYLTQQSRPEITVALTGDGADELFGGYIPFVGVPFESVFHAVPDSLIALARYGVTRLLPGSDGYVGPQFRALAYLQAFPAARSARASVWLSTLPADELENLMPLAEPGFFDPTRTDGAFRISNEYHEVSSGMSSVQRLLYYYQKVFLPEFVCHHTDRAAMMHSLEARSPFLSVPMIEFANRLPNRFKVSRMQLKVLLKHVLKQRQFPDPIVRQRKQGFTFPIARWLKQSMRPMVDALSDIEEITDGEVSLKELNRMIDQHMDGRRSYYRIIYNLIVFRAWRKRNPGLTFA